MKKEKGFVGAYWPLLVSAVIAVGVYFLWLLHYPHLMLAREQSQLFLCNKEYLWERQAEPGGLARYLGEGIVQFFIVPTYGALWYALLFVLTVWLTWRLLRNIKGGKFKMYLLSLIPALLLCYGWTNPKIPMTLTVAVLLALVVMNLIKHLSRKWSFVATVVAMPIGYWLVGPAIVLVAFYHLRWLCKGEHTPRRSVCFVGIIAAVLLLVACILASGWVAPYPVRKLFSGLDYYWCTDESPAQYGKPEKPDKIGTVEEMAYDKLLRQQDWTGITSKAMKESPTSLAVQNEILYAQYKQGLIGLQELSMRLQLSNNVLNSEVAAFIMSDIYLQLGLVNMSQRAAFEAMEAIPNYGKSGRSLQRLVETNMITGNNEVAQKYLSILDETLFYRKWVKKIRPFVEDTEQIQKHPFYHKLQEGFSKGDDTFFY